MSVDKYINRNVEMIYMDSSEKITKRQVYIHSVRDGTVKAFCMTAGEPRTFRIIGILAIQPIRRTA
jgi:predicted DNA-binding transcriptional regulator YafY